MVKPFIKWAGGKRGLIPQYEPHIPVEYRCYHEPFLGGGALFFHLKPEKAILGDMNPHLIDTYKMVRDRPAHILAKLERHQENHSKEYYYSQRGLDPETLSLGEKAARFIYLNATCFNGLYRENKKGQFNVPMGHYKAPKICQPEVILDASRCLKRSEAIIHKGSYVSALKLVQTRDFVFLDPPYYPINDQSFTQYNSKDFTIEDHLCLREEFGDLVKDGVRVMLANSDCEDVRELYRDFPIITIHANRSINSKGSKRGKVTEVLILGNCPL